MTNEPLIPFNQPSFGKKEREYLKKALASGHASGDGDFTRRCHQLLEKEMPGSKVLLTTSGTHALDLAALLVDLGAEDEFVVPSFTFPSTANAFVLRGAKPVFVDIRPDTLNIDETRIAGAITARTRAIVVVHYAGVGCEMDAILKIGEERGIPVIEDNAHGLFGKYRGKSLGTFGPLAAQSFHETKNFSCGEGGALVLNDPLLVERAEILREKGTNRSRFFRGQVDKYSWVDLGSSYVLSDLLAAVLLAQLERKKEIQNARRKIWRTYYDGLQGWASRNEISLPTVPTHCDQAYHLFYLILPSLEERTAFLEHLKSRGIKATFHYVPLHLSDMGKHLGGAQFSCPNSTWASDRLVRLPFYNDLTSIEQARILKAVREFHASALPARKAS